MHGMISYKLLKKDCGRTQTFTLPARRMFGPYPCLNPGYSGKLPFGLEDYCTISYIYFSNRDSRDTDGC